MRYKEIKDGKVIGELDTDEVTAAAVNAMSEHSGLVLEMVTDKEPEPTTPITGQEPIREETPVAEPEQQADAAPKPEQPKTT